ncbi:MAG: ferrochelatase, partial [Bdellovibrionota bacterium]
MATARSGLLLINLGTPDAPESREVREYLREFLMDGDVIDLPYLLRAALVYGVILRKRPAQSAAAYRKIWTPGGSPLLVHHLALSAKLQAALPEWVVAAAMRYGKPSISSAVARLAEAGVNEVVVFPVYPQYSLAATDSSLKKAKREIARKLPHAKVRVVQDFFDHPAFIAAFAERIGEVLERERPDHLLFSFHGLPERQVKRTDTSGKHCFSSPGCCDAVGGANRLCYRAQCFATARLLAGRLGLKREFWSVSFQSRLGQTPWIQPFTDRRFPELAQAGVRKLAVSCPSFVADCLETLEEIQIRGREEFIAAGGTELVLVPSLNSSEAWVRAVQEVLHG